MSVRLLRAKIPRCRGIADDEPPFAHLYDFSTRIHANQAPFLLFRRRIRDPDFADIRAHPVLKTRSFEKQWRSARSGDRFPLHFLSFKSRSSGRSHEEQRYSPRSARNFRLANYRKRARAVDGEDATGCAPGREDDARATLLVKGLAAGRGVRAGSVFLDGAAQHGAAPTAVSAISPRCRVEGH